MKIFTAIILFVLLFLPSIKAEADELVYELQLNEPVLTKTEGSIINSVDGFVIDKNTGGITNALNGQRIIDSGSGVSAEIDGGYFKIAVLAAKPGKFELDFVLSDLVRQIGSGLYADINKNGTKDDDEYRINTTSYAIIPEFDLNQELEFTCAETGYVQISGTVYDVVQQDIGIRYKDGSFLDTTQIRKNGTFSLFLNNKLDLDHGGELELVLELKDEPDGGNTVTKVHSAVIATGVVHHLQFAGSISHSVIPYGTLNDNLEVRVNDLPSGYVDDDEVESDYLIEAKLFDYRGEEITEVSRTDLLRKDGQSRQLAYSPFNKKALNKLPLGDYQVSVVIKRIEEEGREVDKEIYKNTYQLSVLSSAGDLLVGEEHFAERDCGTWVLDLGGEDYQTSLDDVIYYKDGIPVKSNSEEKQLTGGYVLKYSAPGQIQKIVHTLYTDDDAKSVYPDSLPAGLSQAQFMGIEQSIVRIPLYQGGDLKYTLDAYEIVNGNYRRIYTKKGVMELNGYSVTVAQGLVYPNKAVTQVVTVKDQYGKSVNNAVIYYGKDIYGVVRPEKRRSMAYALNEEGKYAGKNGYLFVDTATTNVVNGTYTHTDWELEGDGYLNFVVYRLNDNDTVTRMAVVEQAVLIKGFNAWQVEINKAKTQPGEEETYYINVLDGNGEKVIPDSIDIIEDGIGWRTINSIEINANITNKGIKVVHTSRNETVGAIEFKPRNRLGNNTGSVTVEVVRPEIEFEGNELPLITQDFVTPLQFSVIDPDTGEAIEGDLYYQLIDCGSTAEGGLYPSPDFEDNKLEIIPGDNEYQLYALVKNLNYQEIEYAGVTPMLRLFLISDNASGDIQIADIPIAQAKLAITPSILKDGVKDIIISYNDAMDNPITNKQIKVNYRKSGFTDEQGKLHYYITSKAPQLSILADTDVKYRFVELEVGIEEESDSASNQQQLVSAPEVVRLPRVTLRISHDTEMRYIRVNGKDQGFLAPVKFFMAKLTDLVPGNNKIRVDIFDSNQMSFSETITVFYEKDFEPIVFTIGEPGAYGTPTLLHGTTMVPVRFAADLGAEVVWDSNTNTVYYVRGNREIKMTVGSSYAMVNGELKELSRAPYYNSQGRVMVPLRMVADELGFRVKWNGAFEPIQIIK